MDKNYDLWFPQKKKLDKRNNPPSFKEREIWWCHIGINIGFEIFGKGKTLTRPVLIIKKYSKYTFLGAPLSSRDPKFKNHVPIDFNDQTSIIRLDQLRTYDSRRLSGVVLERIPHKKFIEIKQIVRDDLR